MKRKFLGVVILAVAAFVCVFALHDNNRDDSVEEVASEYEKGYEDGMRDAIEALRGNAYDFDYYMKVDDIEKSIYELFEGENVDADDIRDMIIYNPDYERVSLRTLLERLIDESIE